MNSPSPFLTTFTSPSGATERYYALTAEPAEHFEEEMYRLMSRYSDLTSDHSSEVMLRFHLSDVTTQAPVLRSLLENRPSYMSLVGQSPANGSKIAMEAWHVDRPEKQKLARSETSTLLKTTLRNYKLLLTRLHKHYGTDSYTQTQEEFDFLLKSLEKEGGTLENNTLRTWIYCRDIDNNYSGLVEARKELFEQHGLTPDTHYIASTGIEGKSEAPARLVSMDSLSIFGLQKGQIEYMSAPKKLSPTHIYGVTFERGTRVIYGDRSVYYISGTASIDSKGNVVHPGNVRKQTLRTLENIDALMTRHQGSLADLAQAVVYLRDGADRNIVEAVLAESPLKNIPYIMVKAPVCRPSWLVEIDAIGINANGDSRFANFI